MTGTTIIATIGGGLLTATLAQVSPPPADAWSDAWHMLRTAGLGAFLTWALVRWLLAEYTRLVARNEKVEDARVAAAEKTSATNERLAAALTVLARQVAGHTQEVHHLTVMLRIRPHEQGLAVPITPEATLDRTLEDALAELLNERRDPA